ncbi:hypothetical protein [Mesorhizobium sp. L48C026A00]|uniref:hypothetical protein n=1 Tax=Mesorhizobium sp. L48C026A00 TaxID=1287182 RepID=UPI0003CFAAA0|nr:hypothetical protein [Mesorhizobium sp. L48C026A00]ESZ03715.1 hypothetical protein X737_37380 [Mesorhizobium sp. L48C026A00]
MLWQLLTGQVAVRDPAGTLSAWGEAGIHAVLASDGEARAFLVALAVRLQKGMEDGDDWALDWEAGAHKFLDLVTRWECHIDPSTATGILPVITSWAKVDDTSAYMVRTAEILMRKDADAWNGLLKQITSMSFADLPWTSLEYVASHLGEVTEEHKAALTSQMNAIINADAVDAEAAEKYSRFIATARSSEWATAPLQGHVKATRTRVLAMHTRPDYLSAIYPAARMLLEYAPKAQAGAFLKQLFEQAAGAPEAYPILHREMVGYWPEENDRTGAYEPGNLASRAIQFIRENPAVSGSGDVLRSIVDMEGRGLLPESSRGDISGAVAILWRHSPSSVVACIKDIGTFMTPGDVQKLLIGKQPADPNADGLQAIVDVLAEGADEQRCLSIGREILSVPAKQIDDRPDGALTFWLSSLGGKEVGVLRTLLEDQGLNEDQRERVLNFSLTERARVGLDFFIEIVPLVLAKATEAKPLALMVKGIDNVVSLARTSDQRSSLGSALIPTLPNLPKETLIVVARSINRLGGKGLLERNTDVLGKMDAEQLEMLSNEFKDSKLLTQYARDRGNEAAE